MSHISKAWSTFLPRERASMLCNIAEVIRGRDSSRAEELIGEASLLIGGLESNPLKLLAMLDLARARGSVDAEGLLQTIRAVVDEINQTDFAPEWSVLKATTVRTDDGVIQWQMDYGLSMIPFYDIFAPLARADFDRAVLLAQSISLKEASVFAQFAICRAVLGKPPAPQSPGIAKTTAPSQRAAAIK